MVDTAVVIKTNSNKLAHGNCCLVQNCPLRLLNIGVLSLPLKIREQNFVETDGV
jgi:hypothetical protein